MIDGFLCALLPEIKKKFIRPEANMYTMLALKEQKNASKGFKFAIESVDETFQQSNRLSGAMQEWKVYFSGKHKLYGFKLEVAVRPKGLTCWCSKQYPGSVSDINIMFHSAKHHMYRLEKSAEDN